MIFDIEVRFSLKEGMLNPEATTIERSLDLLGYKVSNAETVDIVRFQMEGDNEKDVENSVVDMCERLLCNPVIHNYEISIVSKDSAGCE